MTDAAAPVSVARRFEVPSIHDNPDGWGPSHAPDRFKDVPYAPYNKSDKLGKAADWTGDQTKYQNRYQGARYNQHATPVATVFSFAHSEDDDSFRTVEGKTPKPKFGHPMRRYGPGGRGGIQRPYVQPYAANQKNRGGATTGQNRGGRQQPQGQRRWQNQGRRWGSQGPYDPNKRPRDFSIEVRPDWTIVAQMEFPQLTKLSYAVDEPEDLGTYGALEYYDKSFDRITTKSEKPLERTDRVFYKVTTTDDPVIQKLVMDEAGNVFATDAILSFLMTSPRSVYSWDLIVTRVGTKLFFDKRDSSQFDYLTVNETANEPPFDDKDSLNSPQSLSQEATFINQGFSQQVLGKESRKYEFENANPFQTQGEEAASVAYKYQRWNLGNDTVLVARCEIDGVRETEKGAEEFLTIKALNEYDTKASGVDWRQKLDSQRGAVLATELKNNSAKLARWTAQALLSGSNAICLGFASRLHAKDLFQHQILGTQFYKPKDFANQINLNAKNMWGILKHIIDTCMKLPEGKYILLKDPNKPQLALYEVPQDAFEEAAEEEPEATQ